jgi:hypothetical protein
VWEQHKVEGNCLVTSKRLPYWCQLYKEDVAPTVSATNPTTTSTITAAAAAAAAAAGGGDGGGGGAAAAAGWYLQQLLNNLLKARHMQLHDIRHRRQYFFPSRKVLRVGYLEVRLKKVPSVTPAI